MTTATLRPDGSSEHRTTRPWHFTKTSRSDPNTSPGIQTVNSTDDPTSTCVSLRKRMPPAEMSMVTARCSSVGVFSVTGRWSGNLTAFRKSGRESEFIRVSNRPTTLQYNQIASHLKLLKYHHGHQFAMKKSHCSQEISEIGTALSAT